MNIADFPYTYAYGRLKGFFKKIQGINVPEATTLKWLESINFKTKKDRQFIKILKALGFVSKDGKPTEIWMAYRNQTQAPKIMASAIKKGYPKLFETYSKANELSDEDLKGFFSTYTHVSDATRASMVATFKALCELADFEGVSPEITPARPESPPSGEVPVTDKNQVSQVTGDGVTININIQLTLPETKDPEVYKSFFQALKTNLLDTEPKKKND